MADKYVCGYCGAEYDSPVERARCEFECDEKRKADAEIIRQQKLKADKETRKESVKLAYQNFAELRDRYIKDYREPIVLNIDASNYGIETSELLNILKSFTLLDRAF